MRIKGILILSAVLISTIITFYGCIDEPDIAHPSRPYGMLRFGNFTTMSDSLEITILPGLSDSAEANFTPKVITLGPNSLLDYFDKLAGKKTISIRKLPTDTIIYNGEIEIPALQINSFYLLGNYSADNDLNSLMLTQIFDGLSYVSHAPASGKINLHFIYLAVEPKALGVSPNNIDIVDLVPNPDTLAAATLQQIRAEEPRLTTSYGNLIPGPRQFAAVKEFDMKTVYIKDSIATDYKADKNWYFIVSGTKAKLNYKVASFNPPPVKGK